MAKVMNLLNKHPDDWQKFTGQKKPAPKSKAGLRDCLKFILNFYYASFSPYLRYFIAT